MGNDAPWVTVPLCENAPHQGLTPATSGVSIPDFRAVAALACPPNDDAPGRAKRRAGVLNRCSLFGLTLGRER